MEGSKQTVSNTDAGFEVQGEWWLPGHEDRRVAGTLRFDPGSGGRISLIGSLRRWDEEGERTSENGVTRIRVTQRSLEESGTYQRIHGIAENKSYTLEDCFQTYSTKGIFGGITKEEVYVNRILKGAHFAPDETLEADGASVTLKYLTHWIGNTGLTEPPQDGKDDAPHLRLDARNLQTESFTLGDGTSVFLKHAVGMKGDGITRRTLTQQFYFQIKAHHLRTIDELTEAASDLQDLVSIGVGRTAQFETVSFTHPDVIRHVGQGRQISVPIEYFVRWTAQDSSTKRLSDGEMFFSYQDIGGIIGIQRWLETASSHRGALSRVMGSRYAQGLFVSDLVLNRAAALEAFDRSVTGYGRSNFKPRLRRCAALAGEPFTELVGDVDAWLEEVRKDRNDIAHHYGRRAGQASSEQYFLSQSLYWLFVLCILRASHMPEKVFDRIRANQEFTWLRPKIRAAI